MAVASAGGHWVQLRRLAPAWQGCRVTYVSTDPLLRAEIEAEAAAAAGQPEIRFFCVAEASRWHKARLARSAAQIAWLLARRRPDAVITTGAAPGFLALRLARMAGLRTVWVDSIANAAELSLSGRMAGRSCDLWLTQWEHLARPEGPHWHGSVI